MFMYNILLIENINNKSISILNTLSPKIPEIKFFKITSDYNEISKILKNHLIDLILLDKSIDNYKYIIKCIKCYSFENNLITFGKDIKSCINKIRNYIYTPIKNDKKLKLLINNELRNLNFDFSYLGTRYLSDAIYEAYLTSEDFDINLNTAIYPVLAKKYNRSINNIKSNIYYSTNMMYCNTTENYLIKNLGLDIIDSKPKLKDIIVYILKKI